MVQNGHIQRDSLAMMRRGDDAFVSSHRLIASALNCHARLKHASDMVQIR